MAEPLVSVIIPVYNAAPYVSEAIESVMSQTYPHKELILVDDGSTDASYEICCKYACEWISVYRLPVNKGQSFANNYGYQRARGTLIKFFDADDILDPGYLQEMMLRYNSEDDLYFSNCVNFYNEFSLLQQVPYKTEPWKTMPPVDFILSPTSFMRQGGRWLIPKKLIEAAGLWNEELSLINDFEYFTRLCLHSKQIHYVSEAVLYYRQVHNSLSSQKSTAAYQSAYKSLTLAGNQLLIKESSARVKKYIADSLQGLLYEVYPRDRQLRKKIVAQINLLGGADKKPDAGGLTLLLTRMFGWKFALLTRYYFSGLKKNILPD
ncbi:glycosyltransferase family 2 protein [Mucilaginibacter calamicampi]|uniref:Glycosyltransferase family 2 protein n=1 Tax=Mucilaginibacter calamicampi TaxID=1302352 RepID=A0ABW2YVG1_9SPHI